MLKLLEEPKDIELEEGSQEVLVVPGLEPRNHFATVGSGIFGDPRLHESSDTFCFRPGGSAQVRIMRLGVVRRSIREMTLLFEDFHSVIWSLVTCSIKPWAQTRRLNAQRRLSLEVSLEKPLQH